MACPCNNKQNQQASKTPVKNTSVSAKVKSSTVAKRTMRREIKCKFHLSDSEE
jgi:hypothetical protein